MAKKKDKKKSVWIYRARKGSGFGYAVRGSKDQLPATLVKYDPEQNKRVVFTLYKA